MMKNALRIVVTVKYVLVLSGIIIGTVGGLAHSAYRATALDQETHLRAIVDAEATLLSNLGYDGLIHNFKNYALRRSENYLEAAMENHHRVLEALTQLETLLPDLGGGEIEMVWRTARKYRSHLAVARVAIARGATPEEIDMLVKVDDTPAVHALEQILATSRARLTAVEAARAQDLKVFVRGLLILIVTIMVLVFLLIVETGRLHREQLDEAEKGLRLPSR